MKRKIFYFIVLLSIVLLTSCSVLKTALYHDYKVKNYDQKEEQEYVIVFHGIYGTEKDMKPIAEMLGNKSYNVISIQYPTNVDNVEKISEKYIEPVIREVDSSNKIHFIAHSMGTGILRYYLKNNELPNLGKVIFLSPPSHGSDLADNPISKLLKDPLGQAVFQFSKKDESFINKLGDPDYPCYIMIGNKSSNPLYSLLISGKNDGMVPLEGSKLDTCDYKIIEKTTHTSILKDKRTFLEIEEYLKN